VGAKTVLVIGGKGYIGSAVSSHLTAVGCVVTSWDTCWFGDHTPIDNARTDYGMITGDDLRGWDTVVLAAGHSGAAMCVDRAAAFANNVGSFIRLVDRLGHRRLVFTSSASLYHGLAGEATEAAPLPRPDGAYARTMYERDAYADAAGKDCYGLRLGTVCGASPNLRSDLMLNRMYLDARAHGVVRVANPERWRPILAMRDLCRAVHRIVESADRRPGIYNVASFNATVGDLAAEASRRLHARLVTEPPSPGYDMRVDTSKFRRTFDFTFEGTVESILEDLAAAPLGHVADRPALDAWR
jgi:nucleoside-diphosphate-sugar epimerase